MLEAMAGAVVVLLGFLVLRAWMPPPTARPQPQDSLLPQQVHQLAVMVASLKTQVDGLPSLWETERKRVERDRAAIEQANRRARRRVEEGDPGAGDEGSAEFVLPPLHAGNGGGGGPRLMPTLRGNVETAEQIAQAAVAREAEYARMMGR